ncbi:MAG: hypothetical protein HOH74_02485 [Gemmatimonadetes bacterium]|nr:hypothetical protein [Gemmatimonadota bacterium]
MALSRRRRRGKCAAWILWLLLLVTISGCAAGYARYMGGTLRRMERRDWAAALEKLEKPSGDTNLLLYRFEKGLILHYGGQWEASNRQFEQAEGLIDRHVRSVSREVASLLTNDAVRPYGGEEHERVLIHYFRALNYAHLGQLESALVECRKANLRLADHAQASEVQLSYLNDAFLQYMTGLFYEATGEVNDAYISYRDAAKGYAAYAEAFGQAPPVSAATDLRRTTRRLGFFAEWEEAKQQWALPTGPDLPAPGPGVITVFAETGIVGRKIDESISIPITARDHSRDVRVVSRRAVHRYHHPIHQGRVKYWLRMALPAWRSEPSRVHGVRLRSGGAVTEGWLVEDIDAIARRTLDEKMDGILARTAARVITKTLVTEAAEEESDILGFLVGLFGAGTEAADTRSWTSLPAAIWMARIQPPPGTGQVTLEFLDAGGRVIDVHSFTDVAVGAGPVFLNWRSFE